MMTKEQSTKIGNFMTHGAGVLVLGLGHIISHVVKMHHFCKNLLQSLLSGLDQTNQDIEMMTKEGSTKIINLLTPWV